MILFTRLSKMFSNGTNARTLELNLMKWKNFWWCLPHTLLADELITLIELFHNSLSLSKLFIMGSKLLCICKQFLPKDQMWGNRCKKPKSWKVAIFKIHFLRLTSFIFFLMIYREYYKTLVKQVLQLFFAHSVILSFWKLS